MIQLKKDNILREPLYDKEGNITDFVFEFDMEDIELPLKVDKSVYNHRKNEQWLKNQCIIIDKKPDRKEGIFTRNERLKLEAFKEFYKKEIENLDMILGEGKTNELLNAMKRKPYYSMFDDINELLDPILPKLKCTTDDIIKKIKDKYTYKGENVIE